MAHPRPAGSARRMSLRAGECVPEALDVVVVVDAARDVLGRLHAVQQRPRAEEAPDDEELEPHEVEHPEGRHAHLRRAQLRYSPHAGRRNGVGVDHVIQHLPRANHSSDTEAPSRRWGVFEPPVAVTRRVPAAGCVTSRLSRPSGNAELGQRPTRAPPAPTSWRVAARCT
jgi:hypothetical protein